MAKSAEILVLDGDPMLGEQLRALLEVLGHRAVCFSSAAKALRALEVTPVEAVFCDYWMPPQGGQTVFRELSRIRPELARRVVFLVSGILGDETRLFFKASGAPQLVKPFKLAAVQEVVERLFLSDSAES